MPWTALEEHFLPFLESSLLKKLQHLKNDIFDKIDKFFAIFTKVDQEQTLLTEKVSRHSDELESHGKRLDHLEQRHSVAS